MDMLKITYQKDLLGEDNMRIALLSKFFLPQTGGIETHVYELANFLTTKGHQVFILTSHENYLKIRKQKLRFKVLDIKSPFDRIYVGKRAFRRRIGGLEIFALEEAFAISEKLEEVGVDVIHAHDPFSAYTAVFVKYMINKPIVLTMHTSHGVLINNDCYRGKCAGYNEKRCISCTEERFYKAKPVFRIFDMKLRRFLLSMVDKIICVSKKDKEDLAKCQGLRNNVTVINNWVSLEKYSIAARNKLRKEFKLSQESKIILSVCRIVPQKGIEYLIKATPFILRRYPESKIVFVGRRKQNLLPTFSYEKSIKSLIEKLRLRRNIIFLGEIPRCKMPALYSLAKVTVLPTLHENYGLVNLESMAYGLPVVTTQLSVIKEYIVNGMNGLLVPPKSPKSLAQAVIKLLDNQQLKLRLIKNGQNTIKNHFNPDRQINKIISVYKDVTK